MNVALHGLEEHLVKACSHCNKPGVIRFADDFVVIHEDLAVIQVLQEQAEIWLAGMGLRLKPSKTHIRHTLSEHEGPAGFDFLGFTVRQFPAAKFRTRTYRGKPGFKTIIRPSEKAQNRHLLKVKDVIRFRRACDREFRHIAQQWARSSLKKSVWANTYYQQVRPGCRSDNQAYRCLANRWLAIAWKLWQTKQPYDEAYHMQQRMRRSKPK